MYENIATLRDATTSHVECWWQVQQMVITI